MDEHPEVLSRDRVYDGRKVALEVHRIRDTAGREAVREVVLHPGSVVILAFPEPGRVLLERNFRYPVGRVLLELPAGTLDEGEAPADCATRELAEETGWRAGRVRRLFDLYSTPGFCSERLTVFLAEDLAPGEPAREAGEEIENVLMPMDQAIEAIRDGRITDSKTVAALLWWDRFGRAEA